MQIGAMSFQNQGGFVARIQFYYINSPGTDPQLTTQQSGNIPLGQSATVDPGSYGVPDGSEVWLFAFVMGGYDNTAAQRFIYQKGNTGVASYIIAGVTLGNALGLISPSPYSIPLTIGKFSLQNQGGFVAKMYVIYTLANDPDGNVFTTWIDATVPDFIQVISEDITLGQTHVIDPGDYISRHLNTPYSPGHLDAAIQLKEVWFSVRVIGGRENFTNIHFKYSSGIPTQANFVIGGTFAPNYLGLINVSE